MLLAFLGIGVHFAALTLSLAWLPAARLRLDPAENLVVSGAVSLLGAFLFAWTVYVGGLPVNALCILPVLAGAGSLLGARVLATVLRDRAARSLVIGQLLVSAWCVGWLALVKSYSGGEWLADWFGHWQRVEFFLERGSRTILFNNFDRLTSRPPLANVLVGAMIAPF